jgi:transposase
MERRQFTREFKLEAVRLIKDRGVSYRQASQDLNVHPSQLRDWVKKFRDDPQRAFPGQGQMKPEQLEIAQLKREVIRPKAAARPTRMTRGAEVHFKACYSALNFSGHGAVGDGSNGDRYRQTAIYIRH